MGVFQVEGNLVSQCVVWKQVRGIDVWWVVVDLFGQQVFVVVGQGEVECVVVEVELEVVVVVVVYQWYFGGCGWVYVGLFDGGVEIVVLWECVLCLLVQQCQVCGFEVGVEVDDVDYCGDLQLFVDLCVDDFVVVIGDVGIWCVVLCVDWQGQVIVFEWVQWQVQVWQY